jgi:hypothetical protein
MNKRKIARDVRRVPTAKTLAYIQGLIAYKRTHIEREQMRLQELETMESELLSVVK